MTHEVVVVGASGFGREAIDVIEAQPTTSALRILGVVDDNPSDENLQLLQNRGLAHLGTLEDWLERPFCDSYVLGIGDPKVRARLVERLDGFALKALTVVHPRSSIGSQSYIGEGAVICAGAIVSTNVCIGRHAHVNPNATIGHDTRLEDFVSVNPGAIVSGDVTLEREVLVGAGATILQGLTVGRASLVGAASLVTKDVPQSVIVKGVPGRWVTR